MRFVVPLTGFQEIGRLDFSFNANGYTVGPLNFPPRSWLHVLIRYTWSNLSTAVTMRFNGDSGANYAYSTSTGGAADITATGKTSIGVLPSSTTSPNQCLVEFIINNSPDGVSYRVMHGHTDVSAGSGTAPTRVEHSDTWASAVQITSITLIFSSSTGAFAITGEILVLGTN